ncbi:MAG: hypothetical protein ACO3ST_01300 [Burkholderiaceae bacterium]
MANTAELRKWELVHATDEDALYVWTGTELINVGTAAATLAKKADLDENGKLLFNQLPPIVLNDLDDVQAVEAIEGSVLTYRASSGKFVADPVDTKLTITDGGNW